MVKKSARRTQRTHTPAFKAKVALATLREDKTMSERIARKPDHGVEEAVDLALGQGLHAVHEAVPLGHCNTELLFDGLRIAAGAVRHLDGAAGAVKGNAQGVVADHTDSRWGRRCGQGAIAGGGQQDVAFDQIVALEQGFLAGASQCPELLASLEHPGGFKLVAKQSSWTWPSTPSSRISTAAFAIRFRSSKADTLLACKTTPVKTRQQVWMPTTAPRWVLSRAPNDGHVFSHRLFGMVLCLPYPLAQLSHFDMIVFNYYLLKVTREYSCQESTRR